MLDLFIYAVLFIFGACFGSFACAYTWRLRACQLEEDKKSGEPYSKQEYFRLKSLLNKKISQDRSICLSCKKQLRWFDLIPVYSWIANKGKCSYCKDSIGLTEFLAEVSLGLAWVATYYFTFPETMTTSSVIGFVIILVSLILLTILFIYDQRWMLLPNRIMFPLIFLGCLFSINAFFSSSDEWLFVQSLSLGIFILSGIYWGIYFISSGKLIGFGDVKLGLALALLLADWRLAFLTLFLSNLIGCLMVVPLIAKKQINKNKRIPFGPLLILGFLLVTWFGQNAINQYSNLFFV